MSWTASAVFTQWILNPLWQGNAGLPTNYVKLSTDVAKCALFGTTASMTPDKNAVVGSTGYNTGQWVTGNEKTSGTDWVATGRALANDAITAGTGFVMYDADDLTSVATATLTGVAGCLIYDDSITAVTVADQGVCYNWFGGDQSVTAGTFSVAFHVNGVCRFTN
jgi:hypothetical protein